MHRQCRGLLPLPAAVVESRQLVPPLFLLHSHPDLPLTTPACLPASQPPRRNSRRLELLYVSGSHSLAPDLHELAGECEGLDPAAKLAKARPMDPAASGEPAPAPRPCRPAPPDPAAKLCTCCHAAHVLRPPWRPPMPLHPCRRPAEGMNGLAAAPAGEACPAVLPAPFTGLGQDITSNSVVCCVYKLPPHRPHSVQLMPGAVEDVRCVRLGAGRGRWLQQLGCWLQQQEQGWEVPTPASHQLTVPDHPPTQQHRRRW